MAQKRKFVALDKDLHCRGSFDCGKEELNNFFQTQASRHVRVGISRTYCLPTSCLMANNKLEICSFYTIAPSTVSKQNFPREQVKKLPQYPIPVLLIAQLAVHQKHQGQGFGTITLVLALQKICKISDAAAFHSVIVDCIDEEARDFYEQYGFQFLCTYRGRARLYLPIKTVRKLF